MTPLRILLVEDNASDVLLVEHALAEMPNLDVQLSTVPTLAGAEALLPGQEFDVVLLDLKLPDGEGLSNFQRLSALVGHTPVILLTGTEDAATALASIHMGAADYLFKGATDTRLLERSILYAIERKKHETSRLELVRARIARAEAEAANRTKDEFLATLSHELRTPLNAILGWASLMRTRQLSPAEQNQALETIERNARVQAQLIEDLLDVSRIVTGNLRLNMFALDISGVVRTAMEVTAPLAEQRNIRVHAELEPRLFSAGDTTRLQQVVWNLISNAIKFSRVNGEVWVTSQRICHAELGECAQITVKDQGQGIAPDMLPHIFERFFQADASSTRRHGGLGLGLSIVKTLVEMHGGQVSASSPGPGQGATFTVVLPIVPIEGEPS